MKYAGFRVSGLYKGCTGILEKKLGHRACWYMSEGYHAAVRL